MKHLIPCLKYNKGSIKCIYCYCYVDQNDRDLTFVHISIITLRAVVAFIQLSSYRIVDDKDEQSLFLMAKKHISELNQKASLSCAHLFVSQMDKLQTSQSMIHVQEHRWLEEKESLETDFSLADFPSSAACDQLTQWNPSRANHHCVPQKGMPGKIRPKMPRPRSGKPVSIGSY